MTSSSNKKKIEESTQRVYDENAQNYDEHRSRNLFEKKYLDKVADIIPSGTSILDLGCGGGEPIAKYLIEKGFKLTGVDYSNNMLNICRQRFPHQTWIQGDMRNINLEGKFDAIISWGAFFHLTRDQQRESLPKICKLLKPTGVLLVTVGPEDGEVLGTVAGESVYHASLSKNEYEMILSENDIEVIEFNINDKNCNGFTVILAKRGE